MSEILLVNPRRRRRHKARRANPRRRKRAMPAALKRFWSRRSSSVKRNPSRRRHHVARVSRRRYRHNPSFGGGLSGVTRSFMPTLKAGALGAVGALANDLAYGYTKGYLPAVLTTGNVAIATRAVYAVLSAMLLGSTVFKGKGRDLGVGAMTVVLHDAGKAVLVGMLPAAPLNGMGAYYGAGPSVGVRRNLPMAGMGRVGRVGQYMNGVGRVGATGVYVSGMGDAEYGNGIPAA
jgi:hypothetical protein